MLSTEKRQELEGGGYEVIAQITQPNQSNAGTMVENDNRYYQTVTFARNSGKYEDIQEFNGVGGTKIAYAKRIEEVAQLV